MHSAVEAWLDALHRQGKSVHTIAAYQRSLAHFIRWSEQSYDEVFEWAVREGHASLNTVMVYTEPRLEDLAERMERVG